MERPLIIGFVSDLMFSTRIESTAEREGFRVEWIGSAEEVGPLEPDTPWRQPAEHLEGPGAALLEELSLTQPALIIFDLNNKQVPWRRWLALIKSAPATRRIPALCFGSHVEKETLDEARRRGADSVVSRGKFVSRLPELLREYARVTDIEALKDACEEPLSETALRGLEEFNKGEYFESHELLEDAWNEDAGPGKELYRAILQIAVAYLQIERGNWRGAVKMFLRVRQWIDPLPDACRGVDVAQLRTDAEAVRLALMATAPEDLNNFDQTLFRPVRYRPES